MDSYYYYQLGIKKMKEGELEQAIDNLKKSSNMHRHYKTFEMLYECYLKLGNKKQSDCYIYLAYCENPRNDKVAFFR